MKNLKLLFCLFALLGFVACGDDEDGKVRVATMATTAGCKTDLNTTRAIDAEHYLQEDSIIYEVKGGNLEIQMINCVVNCAFEKMDYEVSLKDDQIALSLTPHNGPSVNCVCPMDFTFIVENLEAGKNYHCTIKDYTSFDFTMEEGCRGVMVNEDKYNY